MSHGRRRKAAPNKGGCCNRRGTCAFRLIELFVVLCILAQSFLLRDMYVANMTMRAAGGGTSSKDSLSSKESEKAVAFGSNPSQRDRFNPELRTLANIDRYPVTSSCVGDLADDEFRTTLVIQCSLDRLWVVKETCQRWHDPIVVVVALRAQENSGQLLKLMSVEMRMHCSNLRIIEHPLDSEQSKPQNDPLNHLRNVGYDAVQTSHALIMDADLVPSLGLDEMIRTMLKERRELRKMSNSGLPREEKDALVVPVFERYAPPSTGNDGVYGWLQRNSSFIPRNFKELKVCMNNAECEVVCKYTDFHGHATTRTEDWLQGKWYDDHIGAKDEADDDRIDAKDETDDDRTGAKDEANDVRIGAKDERDDDDDTFGAGRAKEGGGSSFDYDTDDEVDGFPEGGVVDGANDDGQMDGIGEGRRDASGAINGDALVELDRWRHHRSIKCIDAPDGWEFVSPCQMIFHACVSSPPGFF